MKYKGIIYAHHIVNSQGVTKYYVGQTMRDAKERWGRNGKGYKDCPKFYRAILKYGWDNFQHEILEEIEGENIGQLRIELNKLEQYYIEFYDSVDNGYNLTKGGNYPSEHFLVKREVVCINTGKRYNTAKDGERDTGVPNKNIWSACNSKTKETTHNGITTKWVYAEDYDENLSYEDYGKERIVHKKEVYCPTNGESYSSLTEASKDTDCDLAQISECCNGALVSTRGFQFQFLEDYNTGKAVRDRRTVAKKVVCLNDGVVYRSLREAAKDRECAVGGISRSCRHGTKCGGYLWCYFDEWDGRITNEEPAHKKKRVRHIETGIIYESAREAHRVTGFNYGGISECCQGKAKCCRNRDTKEVSHWEFV